MSIPGDLHSVMQRIRFLAKGHDLQSDSVMVQWVQLHAFSYFL